MNLIITRWAESLQDVPQHLHPYWCFRDELTVVDGRIMKGNQVFIPAILRPSTLNRLHDAHLDITLTLQHTRCTVYWPKLQDDITKLIQECDEHQQHGIKKKRAPEHQITTTHPIEVIGMDLLDFNGQAALVTVNYFFDFITFDTLPDHTTKNVVKALNNIFSKFGLPERIICDNGPCYKSEAFQCFCEKLDIGYTMSSPYHHQSNGRAERPIATVKQILKRAASQTPPHSATYLLHQLNSSTIKASTLGSAWTCYSWHWLTNKEQTSMERVKFTSSPHRVTTTVKVQVTPATQAQC